MRLNSAILGTPKSEASKRKVPLPELIIQDLRTHLETYTPAGPDAFVFVGVKGGQLRRSNFSSTWTKALEKSGLPPDTHVHDMRHTGNTLTAESGASLEGILGP